jgi:hypothetical protein
LDFTREEVDEACQLADRQLARRWQRLEQSFHRIAGLREALRRLARPGELRELVRYLDEWFTPKRFCDLRSGVPEHGRDEVRRFLESLRAVADDYARASVEIDFIWKQLRTRRVDRAGGQP